MRLRREASLGIIAILGLQLLLSTLAISLLMRMGPAIDRILEENVSSEEAVEEMLASFARTQIPSTVPPEFDEALSRAKSNITQDGEQELVLQVEHLKYAAFQGINDAKVEMIDKLTQIGTANREAMERSNGNAKRLGQAGAWAAAILGALAFGLGISVYRRLLVRLEHPIDRILDTFFQLRSGNHQARCNTGDAPAEVQQIGHELNWVIDQWQKALLRKAFMSKQDRVDAGVSRRLLCAVVDQYKKPLIIKDAKGNVVAANHLALGMDTTDWKESPLVKTEYYFFIPPDELPECKDGLVKG